MAGEKMEAPGPAPGVSDESKLFGALCYIIGIIVPLFVLFTEKKKDKFLAFHAWQSLIFAVALMVIFFGLAIILGILGFIPGVNVIVIPLAGLLSCLTFPLMIVVAIYVLFMAYKAYMGEKYKIPTIGDMAEKRAMK